MKKWLLVVLCISSATHSMQLKMLGQLEKRMYECKQPTNYLDNNTRYWHNTTKVTKLPYVRCITMLYPEHTHEIENLLKSDL